MPEYAQTVGRQTPVDAKSFQDTLGLFCTGVTVVSGITQHGPVGFTCQSLVSLSVDPPLVSISVSRNSRSWPEIERTPSRAFCVNILSASQSDLCARFARQGIARFSGVRWFPAPESGAPVLQGVQAWIEAEIADIFPGGDHSIVTGRVTCLEAHPDREPLIYYRSTLFPAKK